jgi:hypothetical protein
MFSDGEQPEIKPSSKFGDIMAFATLVVLWGLIGVPMFAGIRVFTGEGRRGDLLCMAAMAAIVIGSLLAFDRLSKTEWRSNEQRQIVYIWTHISIWGAALLLFWPQG